MNAGPDVGGEGGWRYFSAGSITFNLKTREPNSHNHCISGIIRLSTSQNQFLQQRPCHPYKAHIGGGKQPSDYFLGKTPEGIFTPMSLSATKASSLTTSFTTWL